MYSIYCKNDVIILYCYRNTIVNRNVVMWHIPVQVTGLNGSYLQINITRNEAPFALPSGAEKRLVKARSIAVSALQHANTAGRGAICELRKSRFGLFIKTC